MFVCFCCLCCHESDQSVSLTSGLSLCRYPKESKPKFNNLKTKKASSFHEFARSTNDAWDIDDEEDEEFLAPASSLPAGLHSAVSQSQVEITD